MPSSSRLRQRLDQVQGRFDRILREESARLAPKVTPCQGELVALDIDVSPWDNSGSHKEGVEFTYKGFCGYAPVFAYLGEEGYVADAELRPGSMHCQKGAPEFIRRSIGYARMMTGAPVLVGMDGGNDSLENIRVCQEEKVDWLIKRNPRRESEGEWLKIVQEEGELQPSRAGERVWVGESYWTSLGEEPARVI